MLKRKLSVKKYLSLSLFFLFILITLTGCVPEVKTTDTDVCYSFTDALGRRISFSRVPQRVAALKGSFADLWLLSGGELCAAPSDAWEDFGIESENCVNLGGAHSPNIELLLSSEPDFVIASASTSADIEMKDILEKAGVTVAYFDVDCFDDYLNMLRICTDITDRADLYEKNGLAIKRQIDKIVDDFNSTSVPEKHKSVLILRASSGFVKAKGSEGTVLGEMLSDLGCINIADSNKSLLENLSAENIISGDPYRIFVVTMGDDTQAAVENLNKTLLKNPAWNKLSAVAENRIHYLDKKLFNLKPNSRWGESYEILCEILCR